MLAASAAGSSEALSMTVTDLYPRLSKCIAVETPKQPHPTMTTFEEGLIVVEQGSLDSLVAWGLQKNDCKKDHIAIVTEEG